MAENEAAALRPSYWKYATLVGATTLFSLSLAQEPPRSKREAEAADSVQMPVRPSANYCTNCHAAPRSDERYWEGDQEKIWTEKDFHSYAYKALTGRRALEMESELQKRGDGSWKAPAARDARCLSCHAPSDAIAPESQALREEGVGCATCHSEGGAGRSWIFLHALRTYDDKRKATMWESMTPPQKAERGFTPLHEPLARAHSCLSCHIGDSQMNRVVTHEMYAAGHPPLPGVELANFSERTLAKHWLPPEDPKKQNLPIWRDAPTAMRADPAAAREINLLLLGGLASLDQQLRLAQGEAAKAAGGAPKNAEAWPDYTHFDCASCHHDLKVASWRRTQAAAGARSPRIPYGRPPLTQWPRVVARVVLEQYASQALSSIDQALGELDAVVAEYGYGKPADVRNAAAKAEALVAKSMDELKLKFAGQVVPAAERRQLVDRFLALGENQTLDYDGARQTAWALRILCSHLSPSKPTLMQRFDAKTFPLYLDLPDRRKNATGLIQENGMNLAARRDYTPAAFAEWCKSLRAQLDEPSAKRELD